MVGSCAKKIKYVLGTLCSCVNHLKQFQLLPGNNADYNTQTNFIKNTPAEDYFCTIYIKMFFRRSEEINFKVGPHDATYYMPPAPSCEQNGRTNMDIIFFCQLLATFCCQLLATLTTLQYMLRCHATCFF